MAKKKVVKEKSNIKTYDQPPEKVEEADIDIVIDKEAVYSRGDISDVIRKAEELQKHPLLCGDYVFSDDAPLAIASKTLQRFIDRLKAI